MNLININTKRIIKISVLCAILVLPSCDFLDVVPDNIATIEHAFRNKNEAENYLYGLFSFMPDVGNLAEDPALWGSDEIWITERTNPNVNTRMRKILINEQGSVSPVANYWASEQQKLDKKDNPFLNGGKNLWTGLSDCNYFLENLDKPFDLDRFERERWTGEALFVKAYLHFWLFRQYGPIPLIRQNIPIDDAEVARQYREPVDEVVKYIVELLDEAIPLLPLTIDFEAMELGRPTRCWATALKAQVLTLAASPLFNCNPDYKDYIDNRGVQLFPQDETVKKDKWKKAADAAKVAIETATDPEAGHRLFDVNIDLFYITSQLSDSTINAMQVRCAATERWGAFGNREIIWGNCRTNNHTQLQRFCCPYFGESHTQRGAGAKLYAPTLRLVEQFYTKNGLPIEDDQEWVNIKPYEKRIAGEDHKQYIRKGAESINLHFNREARFYGSIMFDQGTYFGNGQIFMDNSVNPNYMYVTELKYGDLSGYNSLENSTQTGYLCKKLLQIRFNAPPSSSSYTPYNYAFPIVRLADLYLLYAEALNEAGNETPDPEVYTYINLVRKRTGLDGVVETWRDHAIAGRKNLPGTQAGMREIIRRERLNELAFEGSRFWDLRRWKLAEEYIHDKPIKGWDILDRDNFYKPRVLFTPKFEKKDYFTPIIMNVLMANTNLLQSPYWGSN